MADISFLTLGIIEILTDVVQLEDNPDDVEVDTAKIPQIEGWKPFELALCYVEQQLTAPSIQLMIKRWEIMLQNACILPSIEESHWFLNGLLIWI